jgi:hypothetical protein
MLSVKYNLIIIEEGNVATACGLFEVQCLLDIIAAKPDGAEPLPAKRVVSRRPFKGGWNIQYRVSKP